MVLLFFLGFALLGGVIYMALSKKSSFKVRIAALGALALMIVSVIICIIVYFKGEPTTQYLVLPDMDPSDIPPPPSNVSPATMITLILFLLALFVVIFILALREQKRLNGNEKPSNDW